MTHDHLCSSTNFVDKCSCIDFVIIGYVLKATIGRRVFLKMTRQVYLVVGLFAFVCLYLNTNMKSQRHSTCLSLRRCGCLRVSVCPSLPVCVCLCLSLSLLHLVPSLRVHAKGPESRRQRIIPQSAGPKQRPPLVQRRSLDGTIRVLQLKSVRRVGPEQS